MILKNEILEIARQLSLAPHVVEKDYVLSWILAGISENQALSEALFFKGGTCLKKCYFNSYRLSEDLDFTLKTPRYLDSELLQHALRQVGRWVYQSSGILIPENRMTFDFYENPRGKICCEGRLFYIGPIAPASPRQTPRIKLDLTADEQLVEPPVLKSIDHLYSDHAALNTKVLCYSYIEIFAEKIRALSERTRPRDLYDVIHFYRRPESTHLSAAIRRVLSQKCDYKGVPFPTFELLDEHKQVCAAGWSDQLSHQMPQLPRFELFWDELTKFFSWLNQGELHDKQLVPLVAPGGLANNIRHLTVAISKIALLNKLQFAATNYLCAEILFTQNREKKTALIEPYSLRIIAGNELILYAHHHLDCDLMALNIKHLQRVVITSEHFVPVCQVDFIPKLIE